MISVHRFEYHGLLTRWKSGRMDALTASNHRWLVEAKRGRVALADLAACPECGATEGKRGPFPNSNAVRTHRARKHGILTKDAKHGPRAAVFTGTPVFRTTAELAARYDYIITGGGTPRCFAQAPNYDDEFIELIGWTITEGHYQSAPDYRSSAVILAQDSAANPAYVGRIRMLAAHFRARGATATEYGYGDATRLHWYFGKGIGQVIRAAAPGGYAPSLIVVASRPEAKFADPGGAHSRIQPGPECPPTSAGVRGCARRSSLSWSLAKPIGPTLACL